MKQRKEGFALLRDPLENRGTAFSEEERKDFKLRGLLPPRVLAREVRAKLLMQKLGSLEEPLQKYELLTQIRQRDTSLFYYLLTNHIEELMPIVYTPTVGKACTNFDKIYMGPEGLYVSVEDKGSVRSVLENWPADDVRMIVVTDGERILGLGDLGAGGMGIPIGKLALYTACAGIDPAKTLPVLLDVGTNNQALIQDPYYLGLKQPRTDGAPYEEFVEEFILEAKNRWPNVIIQFEDFANAHAFSLLETWKDKVSCFNDDIQGTASVTVAGLYSACRSKGSRISEETILFLGAGEAATGIADLLVEAMKEEGLSEEEACARIYLFDSKGLVTDSREELPARKARFAHAAEPQSTFLDAIGEVKPTAIVGCAAQAGSFNAYVLGAMARLNEHPIIFALSNPTSKAECTAREAYTYTEGRCIFASGSPFGPVELEGKTFVPRQSNNAYVFPGIGFGLAAVSPKVVPQSVFLNAAKTLSETVTEEDLSEGSLFPPFSKIREVSLKIAEVTAQDCFASGEARIEKPLDLAAFLKEQVYVP